MAQSFYLTLPSNVKGLTDNKISNYVTYLPQTLKLGDNWEVGLAEITYTKSWYNVEGKHRFTIVNEAGFSIETQATLKPGYYENIELLCDEINREIRELADVFEYDGIPPRMGYLPAEHRVIQQSGGNKAAKMLIHLGRELETMLGFQNEEDYEKIKNKMQKDSLHSEPLVLLYEHTKTMGRTAPHLFDLKAGIHALMIYSDLVQPSIVGNTYSQFLRSVQVDNSSKFGDDINIIFTKPYYFPLSCNEIDRILINIKDESGQDIAFRFGRVVTTLHFRQKWKAII